MYGRHYRTDPHVEPPPRLYVTRLGSGSIVAEIAPYAVPLIGPRLAGEQLDLQQIRVHALVGGFLIGSPKPRLCPGLFLFGLAQLGRGKKSRPDGRRYDASVFIYAFDLIELNGDDLRRDPLEVRKATLASVQGRPRLTIQ
jgi:hypothetical protein